MTTANEICTSALRRLRVIGVNESAAAEDAATALEVLNDMLAVSTWANLGLTLPLAASDTVAVDIAYIGTIKNNLTVELQTNFGKRVTPDFLRKAKNEKGQLWSQTRTKNLLQPDSALTRNNDRF